MPPRQAAYLLDIFRSVKTIQGYVAGTSVVTSKPANEGHFKTGQRDPIQDESVVPRRGQRRQVFSISFGAPLGWLVYTGQT